ncbi:MAG TPA: serine/threonine-protein kinase, partial [Gemmatimonadaceae bacterium]|nr:serine/threonine-protein kinase [Gemmatimonadaceae bacterium]
FQREIRLAASLQHPHIVPVLTAGKTGQWIYYTMPFVPGESLRQRLAREQRLPVDDVIRLVCDVAEALSHAHEQRIVHRDVKPDNILLEASTGRALVTDFGIAHVDAHDRPVTDPGKIMGTAHFMSPEQAANEPVDGRSDLYSLGVVGYLTASGRLPFEASNLPALLVRQATEVPPSVMRAAPGLPAALGAAIDRCLARDSAGRFADGEALAAALAPAPDARPALPPTLRAWIGARNPLLLVYMGLSGVVGTLTLVNLIVWLAGKRPDGPADIVILAAITSLPLLPIVGFHLNQARRQFRAGHTIADLRSALEIARRERAESEALAREDDEAVTHRVLRLATVGSATWLAVTLGFLLQGTIHENRTGIEWLLVPLLGTMTLGAVSNALDVQFIPARIRDWWQTGIRERLWNSRAGEWVARRLGAPERSGAVGGGVFRATEVALGVAASELFAALPKSYREQLSELPATVAALEARAAEARAEIDALAALAPSGSADADVIGTRRAAASAHLAESVAALEGIRLDLLRLHAGAGDLAPLTTLIDAARLLGEDVSRLADARREVDGAAASRLPGARRVATPA